MQAIMWQQISEDMISLSLLRSSFQSSTMTTLLKLPVAKVVLKIKVAPFFFRNGLVRYGSKLI